MLSKEDLELAKVLTKVKEVFEEAFLAEDEDKIIELINQHPELPVSFVTRREVTYVHNKVKKYEFELPALKVHRESDGHFRHYEFGNWNDIDEAIMHLTNEEKKYAITYKDIIKAYTEEEVREFMKHRADEIVSIEEVKEKE